MEVTEAALPEVVREENCQVVVRKSGVVRLGQSVPRLEPKTMGYCPLVGVTRWLFTGNGPLCRRLTALEYTFPSINLLLSEGGGGLRSEEEASLLVVGCWVQSFECLWLTGIL